MGKILKSIRALLNLAFWDWKKDLILTLRSQIITVYNMVNLNLTTTLNWTYMSILVNTTLSKIPIKYDACFFSRQVLEVSKDGSCAKGLCSGWGSVARGDRDCFCPGLLDSGCWTALRSRRQQVWISHGVIIKVTPRPIVNVHEPLWLSVTCLVHFYCLSSPKPQIPQYRVLTFKNSFICSILHGKHRSGACGCSLKGNGVDEIDGEKSSSLLHNLVQVVERAPHGLTFFLWLSLFFQIFFFFHHFEITYITKKKRRVEAGGINSQLDSLNTYKLPKWLALQYNH